MASTATTDAAQQGNAKPKPVITNRDIVFMCPSCEGELVVDRDGAGMECLCAHCGFPLVVPMQSVVVIPPPAPVPPIISNTPAPLTPPAPVPAVVRAPEPQRASPTPVSPPEARPARHFDFSAMSGEEVTRRLDDLKHQLKENRSQDTEMRGHVNRATIELHRLQLRLKKLQDRQADIEAEVIAATEWVASAGN